MGASATPLVNVAFPDPRNNVGDYIGGTAATGLIGGLASVAGGGKFENGAVTAAFGYMYNNSIKKPGDPVCYVEGDCRIQGSGVPGNLAGGGGGFASGRGPLDRIMNAIERYFGGPPMAKINKAGDTILMRGDKKVRFEPTSVHVEYG